MIPTEKYFRKALEKIDGWSSKQKIMVLIVIWILIFVPAIFIFTSVHRRSMFSYHPEGASPLDDINEGWNVSVSPEPDKQTEDRYIIEVEEGEEVKFRWNTTDYTARVHLGQVNVYYNTSWGEEGVIRLRQIKEESEGQNETWERNKTFDRSGDVYYYFRTDKSDVALYQRRAEVLLEGGNLYEDIRTDPPPIINFLFIPPTALSAPGSIGGYYLSFYIYFAFLILIGAFLIHSTFRSWGENRAFLASVLYIANPLTVYTLFQDSGVVAFLLILSIFLIVKGWKKLGMVSIGLGTAAKVWSGFLIPSVLFDGNASIISRIKYLLLSSGFLGGSLLFFYRLWGPQTFFFITFYGGGAAKFEFQGINIWAGLNRAIPSSIFFSTDIVLIGLVIAGLVLLYIAYKRRWDFMAIFTVIFLIFLLFYPKIHWWYFFIPFPILVFYSVRDSRKFNLFLGLTIFSTLANFSRHRYFPVIPSTMNNWISLIFTLIFTLIGLKMIHLFLTEEDLSNHFDTVLKRDKTSD